MSDHELPIHVLLARHGISANDQDLVAVAAMAGGPRNRRFPRRDTEPQLIQRAGNWEQA